MILQFWTCILHVTYSLKIKNLLNYDLASLWYPYWNNFFKDLMLLNPQATQTLFVIYVRDGIALRFEPFKRMYENGWKLL